MDFREKIKKLRELKADKKELYWLIYTAGSYLNVDILKTDLNRLTNRNRRIISYEDNIFHQLSPLLYNRNLGGTIVELYDQGDLASVRLSGEYHDLVSRSYLNKRNLTVENVKVTAINVDVDKLNEICELWSCRHTLVLQRTNIDAIGRQTRHYNESISRFNREYNNTKNQFDVQINNHTNKQQFIEKYQPEWDLNEINHNIGYFNTEGVAFTIDIKTVIQDLEGQHYAISQKIVALEKQIDQLYLDMKLN